MARVVILWKRPYRLSVEEAQRWTAEQIAGLLAADTVRRAELTPVRPASARHPADCDWMLDVELSPGHSADDFVDEPAAAAWLSDLQQLRLEPRVIVVDGSRHRRPDDR